MPEKMLSTYATITAKVLYTGEDVPPTDDRMAFLNYADFKFLEVFLNNRKLVAEAAAERYPEFLPLVQLIEANNADEGISNGSLEQELDAIYDVLKAMPGGWLGIDPNIAILAAAIHMCIHRADSEEDADARNSLLKAVGEVFSQEEILGYANFIAPCIFWYSHYEGFEERVIAEYRIIEAEIREEKAQREADEQRAKWRMRGLCQHCGGPFKGLIKKACVNCGRPKDY